MPPNITPPLVLRYGATDVPIIQLSLSSTTLPDTKLNDLGQNIIRPDLAVVHGAEVPQPYGGKPRVIMADLDAHALSAHGLSPSQVSDALLRQNVILPAGDVKIGSKDYELSMNNSPDVIETINSFPIEQVDGKTVFMRDIAHVHDGYPGSNQFGVRRRHARRIDDDPQDRRRLDARRHRRHPRGSARHHEVHARGP